MWDAVIVGGGPVGQFLALAAAASGKRSLLFEAKAPGAGFTDDRTLALSWSSWLMLQRVGAATDLLPTSTPIRTIHVSQRGGFGRSELSAQDAGVPALGYVIGYGDVQRALARRVAAAAVRYDAPVERIDREGDGVVVHAVGESVAARCAIVAEGGGPLVEALGFTQREKDYGVHAVVARVRTDRGHEHVAFERFADVGPLALLPRGDGFALVWTLAPDDARAVLALDEPEFLSRLQRAFGWRAGRFITVAERGAFPLVLRMTQPRVHGPVALVGNAAQTLHPVAGQGLNLGLRDAWLAAKSLPSLDEFDRARRLDRSATVHFTDALAAIFAADWPGLSWARGAGLTALDMLPAARRMFARSFTVGHLRDPARARRF
jgi:2-octaprenyl-6-methoxyphenol hydroxylase